MAQTNHSIDELLHRQSPNYTGEIRVRKDFIIEAPPVGFFRLAFAKTEESTYAAILYYLKYPHDFDPLTGSDDAYPVCIMETNSSKWDPLDPREQHNTSWVSKEIMRVVHLLPAVSFREKNLHRHDRYSFGSAFVGYREIPDEVNQNYSKLFVTTNTRYGFDPIQITPLPELVQRKDIYEQFRAFGRVLLRRLPSVGFNLGVEVMENGVLRKRRTFIKDAVLPVMKADYLNRNRLIDEWTDPIKWRDNKFLPVVRVGAKLQKSVEEMRKTFSYSPRRAAIHLFTKAGHFLIDHNPLSIIGSYLLDRLEKANLHKSSIRVPEKWCDAIQSDNQVLSIDAQLHKILLKIKPEKFREYFPGLQWAHPDAHSLSHLVHNDRPLVEPDDGFATWLKSRCFKAEDSLIEYYAEDPLLQYKEAGGHFIAPHECSQHKVIRANVPDGLQMYQIPETGVLYGYYHELKLGLEDDDDPVPQQEVPEQYRKYFHKDKVLRVDMTKGAFAEFTEVDFQADFAPDIHAHLGGQPGQRVIRLLSAEGCPMPVVPAPDVRFAAGPLDVLEAC